MSRAIEWLVRLVGALLLAAVTLHYAMDTWCMLAPTCDIPVDWVTRYACLCPIAGLLVGLGMTTGSRLVTTYGVVLWLMFPLGATIHQFMWGHFGFEWPLAYQLVLLGAVPLALVTGRWVPEHVPLAVGVSLLGVAIKGFVNQLYGSPEAQIWLVAIVGERELGRWFAPINWSAFGLGLVVTAGAGWWLVRRRRRRRRDE